MASFCFTLCRKGRLSAGGWHAAYTASLLCAYAVGLFSAPVAVDGARRAREIWLLSAVAAAIAALRATGRAPDKFVLWGALWAGALLAVRCGSLDRIVL